MNTSTAPVIGIDLGTTNSVVAVYLDGQVRVLEEDGSALLPSVVGLTIDGKLITGTQARNQLVAFPDRTIASVKRRMGEAIRLKMADQEFSPQEISAIILRKLRERAERAVGQPVSQAVITVPAFFNENQRQATREAGELAGLQVQRIINEPTAASLVYHAGQSGRRHLMIYDLGGGTFDVSIVRMEDGVIEVLSSKGDTQLGGDDFDRLLTRFVADRFSTQHGVDLTEDPATRWRLLQACEQAKRELSEHTTAALSEEFIATVDGKPLNLMLDVERHEYEELILPLVEQTIRCVDQALHDANLTPSQIDELILVGGSSRTPLVQQRLRQEFQHEPHWAINPDLAVALGAATQAAIQSGASLGPVLVDVATHSLGVRAASGDPFAPELVYVPIIHRNSPLPARYEEPFSTMYEDQVAAEIHVYQGESPRLEDNQELGSFVLEGLNQSKQSDGKVIVRFELTLDGTLSVTAVERRTGIAKSLKIQNALSAQNQEFRQQAMERLGAMFSQADATAPAANSERVIAGSLTPGSPTGSLGDPLQPLFRRAAELRQSATPEDVEEIDELVDGLRSAVELEDKELIKAVQAELEDLLFYIGG